jgi:uncharacterized membrane protein YeaQ/YmgE (transglycosylase-associated protein family)
MEASSQPPSRPQPAAPAKAPPPSPPKGPAPKREAPSSDQPSGKIEQLKLIGGLLALSAGLLALLTVLVISKWVKVDTDQFTQLATTVIGVIGSIVGAYFGVKIGTDGTQKALEAQRQDSARSQIFAAHLDPEVAKEALRLAFPSESGSAAAQGPADQKPAETQGEDMPQ